MKMISWQNISTEIKILFLVYLLTLPLIQPWVNSDGIAYYAQLRSIIIDQDVHFENEFRHYQEVLQHKQGFLQKLSGITDYTPGQDEFGRFNPDEEKTVTGYTPNRTSIGPAILWLPFFIVGHVLALIFQSLGFGNVADGYSLFYVLPVTLGTTIYGFLGLLLCYRIAGFFSSPRISLIAVLSAWFASPLIYYMYLVPTMAHTLSMFMVALFLYCWLLWRTRLFLFQVLILGIFGGLLSLVRWQNAIFLLLPLGDILFQPNKYKFTLTLSLGMGFIFGFLPQMLLWKTIYGSPLLIPMGNDTMNWFRPMICSVLFSSRHGLLTWSPLFIFSITGLYLFYKKEKNLTLYFLLILILEVYINAVPSNWWCGSSFGYRRLLDCLPIFIIGLSILISQLTKRIPLKGIIIILALLAIWNIGLMIQFAFGMISHTEPVPFAQIAYNMVSQVPLKLLTMIRFIFLRH